LIPVVIGTIGAAIPAERAGRMTPSQGITEGISIRKAVERRLKWAVISITVILIGGFVYTMIQVAPNITADQGTEDIEMASPTEGGQTEKVSATVDKEENTEGAEDTEADGGNGVYWNDDRIEEFSKYGFGENDKG